MTKKSMFKRILKIFGIVFLGAVILVGCVIGFMAIRGDFKKKKIEPTEVYFDIGGVSIENMELEYNVGSTADENIYSFTVKALPEDATELECTLKVSEPSFITFKTKKDGEWVDYTSNAFYLNRPIYFAINNVTDDNINWYNDGIITITVEAGYVKGEIPIEVDRSVTSISLKDWGVGQENKDNNKITNGLFGYEYVDDGNGGTIAKYNGQQEQKLSAVIYQSYDLEILTAPLKASKPFAGKDEKEYEIYYVKSEQLQLLTHEGETVKLQTFDNEGNVKTDSCDFLTFDTEKGKYVFTSANAGEYKFKLAMYPTYEKQERLKADETLGISERLGDMITKDVIIKVSGTDVQTIEFASGESNLTLNLSSDNKFILNNSLSKDATNLGLTLSQSGGAEITGRFNELKFLSDSDFSNSFKWVFNKWNKTETDDGTTWTDAKETVTITFNNNTATGKKQATVTGVDKDIDNKSLDAELTSSAKGYILRLLLTGDCVLSIDLSADEATGKLLSLITETKNGTDITTAVVNETRDIYLSFVSGSRMILGSKISGDAYDFKTLTKDSVFLAFIGKKDGLYQDITSKFKTVVDLNGADTLINITPMDGDLSSWEIKLYGIVVNTDGSMSYTATPYGVTIIKVPSTIEIVESELNVPVQIKQALEYGVERPIDTLVQVSTGSYKGVLLFAPKFHKVQLTSKPNDWDVSAYYVATGNQYVKATEWDANEEYFRKNNYKFIESIYYKVQSERYYLLGYIGIDGKFVNDVVVTGENYNSKLYAFVPQTKYLEDYNRNQTAEEYINSLLNPEQIEYHTMTTEEGLKIIYDASLIAGKKVFDITNGFDKATEEYDRWAQYYILDEGGNYVQTNVPVGVQNDWENEYSNYYIAKPQYINVDEFVKGAQYYKDGELVKGLQEADWNKDDYYIKVDYYIIKSVQDVLNNKLSIIVNACSNGIEFNIENKFTITRDDDNNIKITNADERWDLSKCITVDCYYDFANSTAQPQITFGGSYYADNRNATGNNHYIIAGHKNIDFDWNGNTTGTETIKNQSATTDLILNCVDNEVVLRQIIDSLQLKAYEYDKNDVLQKNNCTAIEFAYSFEQAPAGKYDDKQTYYTMSEGNVYTKTTVPQAERENWAENYSKYYIQISPIKFEMAEYKPVNAGLFDSKIVYYKLIDGKYTSVSVSAEDISNWETARNNYYIQTNPSRLSAEFWANNSLTDGNYVKLIWIYTIGEVEYKFESGKLYIQSRDVVEYKISLPSTAYKATLITDGSYYTGEIYEFKQVDGEWGYQYVADRSAMFEKETADEVANWETQYKNYYSYDEETGFTRLTSAGDGYKKSTYYKFVANKFYKLQDYVLETAETIDDWENEYTKYYTYSAEGGYQLVERIDETVPEYEPNKYFRLEYIKYTGKIQYKIVVGYEAGNYTYKVYALDSEGKYLFKITDYTSVAEDADGNFSAITTDLDNAFTLGGWIRYEPFYANGVGITMDDNKFLEWTGDDDNKTLVVNSVTTDQINKNATITLRNTSGIELKITVIIEQEDGCFGFEDFAPVSSSGKLAEITRGHFKYIKDNASYVLDAELDLRVKSISIMQNGRDITSQYTTSDDGLTYTNVNDQNNIITIKYDGQWKVERSKFVNVELTLTFSCFLGSKDCTISLTNPYTITHSATNVTNVIYSGTNFKIAKVVANGDSDDTDDTLYTFTVGAGSIEVYYYKTATSVESTTYYVYNTANGTYEKVNGVLTDADIANGTYYVRVKAENNAYNAPIVDNETQVDFEIEYQYDENNENTSKEVVDTFALLVKPNAIIMGNTDKIIEIDDYNTTYNIADENTGLKIRKFKDGTYTKYELVDENLEDISGEVTIEFETYTDSGCQIKYSTNLVRYDSDSKKVIADVITEKGVYYAIGYVKANNVLAGEIKFKITVKSEIVGENADVEDLVITAKLGKEYELADLQKLFNLKRNGEYYAVDNFVEGKTYKLADGKYVLLEEAKAGITYYQKYNLTDIFYINYTNPNLEITYTYNGEEYTQKYVIKYSPYTGEFLEGVEYYHIVEGKYVLADSKVAGTAYYTKTEYMAIVYNNVEYKCIGTTYNFEGLTYNLRTGLANTDGSQQALNSDDNVIQITRDDGSSSYYCKQNALIFEDIDRNLLILSYNGNKKLHLIGGNTIELTGFVGLTVTYTAFGENVDNNEVKQVATGLVGEIEYSIIPVYTIEGTNYCINTKDIYKVCVEPYTIQSSAQQIVAGRDYNLDGLFGTDEVVTRIVSGAGEGYLITNGTTLTAHENGNKNTISIPVTITYTDGTIYKYNAPLSVLSETVVEISYPFNVDNATGEVINIFTTSIEELTNNTSGFAYDLTDLGEWLGYDTQTENWEQSANIKFDLLLAGDKVDLSKADNNNGLTRFATFQRATATYDETATYYIYNSTTQKYEQHTVTVEEQDNWGEDYYNYFTKTNAQIGDNNIQLVAVSSTLAGTLTNVQDNIICRNGTITIGEDFNYTGYLAFKVYIKDSTAYGYYIVKVVDDANFDNTIDTINTRYSGAITKTDDSSVKIIDLIKTASTTIATLGRLDSALIASDLSNIYLFMIDNHDSAGNKVKFGETDTEFNTEIDNYQLINSNLYLQSTINTQTIKLAVVINCNTTSLVYVCNYTITINTNLTVTPAEGVTQPDQKNDNEFAITFNAYNYNTASKNEHDLSGCLTVEDNAGQVNIGAVTFDVSKNEGTDIDSEGSAIRYKGEEFAKIDGTTLLTLTKGVSQTMKFCLTLTYTNGYLAYLQITIKPIELASNSNNFIVGDWDGSKFNTSLSLNSKIFNGYHGNFLEQTYALEYSIDNSRWYDYEENQGLIDGEEVITLDNETVKITSTTREKYVYIRLILNDVVPVLHSNVYTIKCLPSISTTWAGDEGQTKRLAVNAETDLLNYGSSLSVNISSSTDSGVTVTTITIYNGSSDFINNIEEETERNKYVILTTKVANFKSVIFGLLKDGEDATEYFVSADNTWDGGTNNIQFIHLPDAQNLTLTMIIMDTNDGAYTGVAVNITLPKTYELKTSYRVSDYQQLSTKPADWNVNYNDYYTFVKNNFAIAPTFNKGLYYKLEDGNYQQLNTVPSNWSTNYNDYYALAKNNVDTVPTFDEKVYYKRVNAGYETMIENKALDLTTCTDNIKSNFFGYTDKGGYAEVNTSRLYIIFNGKEYSFNDAYNQIGLLTENNLNYLLYNVNVETTLSSGGASLQNKSTLQFGSAGDNITLSMGNQLGCAFEYNFQVFTADTDYATFTFADLLVVDDDYVSVSRYDLLDANNEANTDFTLGYLRYYANNTDGDNFAWVKSSSDNIVFVITQNAGGGVNAGAIQLEKFNNANAIVGTDITITIITIDGIAKQFTFTARNINIDYGYSGSYENLYAGTEGYKLTDNTSTLIDTTSTSKTRVNLTDSKFSKQTESPSDWETNYNNYYTYNATTRRFVKNNFTSTFVPEFSNNTYYSVTEDNKLGDYTIEYKGAMGGKVSYLAYDATLTYPAGDTSMISWDETNKTFAVRAVNNPMQFTLIFDIKKNDGGKVITRIYYPIRIQNDIRIGVNKQLDETQTLDLYLGSEAYSRTDNTTTEINLMESHNTNGENNIFVTLERFSTGNIIYDDAGNYIGKGLYNGTNGSTTQSVYNTGNVSQYLRFSVTNLSNGMYKQNDKGQFVDNSNNVVTNENSRVKLVEVASNGMLTITGNPSGSFTLNVYSTNGTGYGKSFDIQVHPYYKVTAKFNDSIANLGSKKSGDSVDLINTKATIDTKYAFNVQHSMVNSLAGDEKLSAGDSSITEQKMIISSINTSIDDIKTSDKWSTAQSVSVTTSGKYYLPAVPYSSTAGETTYYIVSVRIGVKYNGQTTYYYAHYRVYNDAYIEVNDYYIDNNKTITYGDANGCWTSGNTLTLMDADGKGMYNSLVPLTSEPESLTGYYQCEYAGRGNSTETFKVGKYYTKDSETGVYSLIRTKAEWDNLGVTTVYVRQYNKIEDVSTAEWKLGEYFKLNDVVGKFYTTVNTSGSVKVDVITAHGEKCEGQTVSVDGTTVTLTLPTLPSKLFTNSGTVTIIFRDMNTNQELLRDEWTFKSNNEITPKSTKLLNDFFLLSEINNQQYYNTPIVGIMSSWNETTAKKFVNNASSATRINEDGTTPATDLWSKNGVSLYKVRYTGNSGDVFTTTYDAYVLVGKSSLMQINFNGGNYYINYTVDDTTITNQNVASVDVANYVTMWKMNSSSEFGITSITPTISIVEGSNKATLDGTSVKLKTVNDYTSGQSITIKITDNDSGVARTVDLYFNIIITAKALNESKMAYDSKVGNAMGDAGELTADDINSNSTLKTALLEKIKFNGVAVNTSDYDKFTITITKGSDCYNIVYTYKDAVVSYTRTIKMSLK